MKDMVLRDHPQFKDLFIDKPVAAKPEVHWLPPFDGLRNSKCGRYQCRKAGDEYSLWSIRVLPFARLLKDGFKSFAEVQDWIRNQP